jgi:two-component system response regulator AtoC
MDRIKKIIAQVAKTDITVLIQGESGVGKEVVARAIHLNSPRHNKPFIKINCAALPSELLESELFGYEKGAFTGAYQQKPGKFELAHGGTIFLDEIGDISTALQAKLLQVLQDNEFSRLGGKKDVRVDVRILAATNKNIYEAVKNGLFREDLYYRLNIVNITVPPLRERKEEIPVLVDHFLEKLGKKYEDTHPLKLSASVLEGMIQYNWPGNIRELENFIHRFIVLGNEETILESLPINLSPTPVPVVVPLKPASDPAPKNGKGWPSLKDVNRKAMVKAESEAIQKVLSLTCWNRRKAANLLSISYKTLLYKMKECAIG